MSYDVIGDIHGHDGLLLALLRKLGYRLHLGAWRHAGRTAIFVGDFIDRGPGQLATIGVVRSMLDAGSAQAIMGNHEFNAISWHTPDPQSEGLHLRRRNTKHRQQHEAFLTETEHSPELHAELVTWFLSLPLWLELPGLCVVHACWDPSSMAALKPLLDPGNRLTPALVETSSRPGRPENHAVETLLKGIEVPLPPGHQFKDKNGDVRHNARVRWWDMAATTFRNAPLLSPEIRAQLPDEPLPSWARIGYAGDKPVFFGHYWMHGEPRPLAPRVACVDYSAGSGGPLVAYRWDGERELAAANFISVPPGASS